MYVCMYVSVTLQECARNAQTRHHTEYGMAGQTYDTLRVVGVGSGTERLQRQGRRRPTGWHESDILQDDRSHPYHDNATGRSATVTFPTRYGLPA